MKDTFNHHSQKDPAGEFFQQDAWCNKKAGPRIEWCSHYELPAPKKTDYFSGGGGLVSTIYDYAVFLPDAVKWRKYNTRLLAHNTVRMIAMNQIGDLL